MSKLNSLFDTTDLDKKSLDFLIKAIARNNLDGFDFLEFKQSVVALGKMGMDPAQAIKSAFTTASTMGITKDHLLKSGKHYVDVLQKEKHQFELALEKQVKERVESKLSRLDSMKAEITENERKIELLQKKNQQYREALANADSEIEETKKKLSDRSAQFQSTFDSVKRQIDQDIANLETYL